MTLFKIALKNIKRNFQNYFIYFVSMVFSIMIYFTFTSIQYNNQVLNLVSADRRIDVGFKASSIVIAIFAAIFIWYSNSFFTRKRKREIALYSMMGIKKKQIGRMMFYENIAMGLLALGAGIFMGSILSKVFIMLLVRLMGFNIDVHFAIIPKAIIDTAITFTILFLITSIHGYTIIFRFKLIDLFSAEKSREREPKASVIAAVLSILFIGGGYFIYHKYVLTPYFLLIILATLVLVVVGTFLLFSSLTVFIIRLAKKNTPRYYKGINLIGTSQLLYRIKSHSRTLATIAVLSATTLTAMGVTASMYYDFQTRLNTRYPFSYVIPYKDTGVINDVEAIMGKYAENKILGSVNIEYLKLKGILPDVNKLYKSQSTGEEEGVLIIPESKFNEIAETRGLKDRIRINSVNESVLINEFYNSSIMESYTGKTVKLNLNNQKSEFVITDFKDYPLINEFMVITTLVVKDEVYTKYYDSKNIYNVKAYINDNRKNSEGLTKELINKISEKVPKGKPTRYDFSSYYESYKDGLMSSGLTIFIGAFLGLVFLMSTGSIIFFKQLSEANDDRSRYAILKKIGVNKNEIRSSIARQMLFVFALPLLVGIVHSLVAVSLLNIVLTTNLLVPIVVCIGAYTAIYMIYYVLTVNSYNKIVNSRI